MPCTRPAAGSPCRSCTPGATRTRRGASRRPRVKSPISRFSPRALSDRGVRRQIRRLRPRRPARARGRVRRRRDHGVRGLPHQPVPRAAHQPADRRVGWQPAEAAPVRRRDRARGARGGRPRLHRHLPHLGARPRRGGPDLGRGDRARHRGRGGRRQHAQPGHRLARGPGAHHRHLGAARRVHVVRRAAQGARVGAGRRHEPDQHARRRRGGAGRVAPTSCRWPGRSSPTPSGCARRPSRAPTRSTRASPATRPAWTTPSSRSAPPAWSTRAPAHETELVLGPTRTVQEGRRRRRRPGRARRGDDAGRARPRGRAVRGPRPHRRPVRHRDADPRQGGVRRDDPLLHPPPRPDRRQGAPRPPGRRRRARRGRLRPRSSSPPGSCRGCRPSPASTTRW